MNYAAAVPIISDQAMGWLRCAVGAALIAAPGVPLRLAGRAAARPGRNEPTGANLLLMRTIGIRDLVLGLGAVAAARSGDADDARRWTTAALTSDSLDVVASLTSIRSIGKRDAWTAALLAFSFVCGDIQALQGRRRG
jgi:hypothetical protein